MAMDINMNRVEYEIAVEFIKCESTWYIDKYINKKINVYVSVSVCMYT